MRVRYLVALLVVLAGAYLTLWPTGSHFAAFPRPGEPMAVLSANPLDELTTLGTVGEGPEDVAVASDGTLYTGIADGHVMMLGPRDNDWRPLLITYGRPLGLALSPDERLLYIADGEAGLMRADLAGHLEQLVATLPGGADLGLVDDLAVHPTTGQVFFTSATDEWSVAEARDALLEHHPTGRLLRFDPRTRRTDVLLDSLQFANGVAITLDGTAVLVAETGNYDILRYELSMPDSGTVRVFAADLPGFPDGLNYDDAGLLWVSLVAPRNELLDDLLPRPFLRELVYRLPESFKPQPERMARVLALDASGQPVTSLEGLPDDERPFAMITNVVWRGDTAYFGSLRGRRVGRLIR